MCEKTEKYRNVVDTRLNEFALNVPLDDGGPGVGVGDHLERGVDRDLAVHGEEAVDGVREVHAVQRGQRHGRVDLQGGTRFYFRVFACALGTSRAYITSLATLCHA